MRTEVIKCDVCGCVKGDNCNPWYSSYKSITSSGRIILAFVIYDPAEPYGTHDMCSIDCLITMLSETMHITASTSAEKQK
jgi:hypothetical protein